LREGIVHDGDIWPNRCGEFTLGHQTAVVLHEIDQNLERLGTQRHFFSTAAQEAGVQIQHEAAKRVLAVGPVDGTWIRG
jgi:hypothetical protein